MTLDDAAAILDVTEEHVKDLIRDKVLRGSFTESSVREKRRLKGGKGWAYRTIRRTLWTVNGQDVRKRRRALR